MRKTILIVLLAFFASFSLMADEDRNVVLKYGNDTPDIELGYITLSFKMGEPDDNNITPVTVVLVNPDESNIVILFDRSYSEKELRRRAAGPRVVYDRVYSGARITEYCEQLKPRPTRPLFMYYQDFRDYHFDIAEGETLNLRLPLYIAIEKRCKKVVLCQRQIVNLSISVELQPDADYMRLERSCDSIISVLKQTTFCNNDKHEPSIEEQKMPYQTAVQELQSNIRKKMYGVSRKSYKYRMYNELKQRLSEEIVYKEGDCGNHKKAVREYPYSSMSLEAIYNEFNSIYQEKCFRGEKLTAAEVSRVKAMYNCCSDPNCPTHGRQWGKSEFRNNITDYYNRIIRYSKKHK